MSTIDLLYSIEHVFHIVTRQHEIAASSHVFPSCI